LGRYGRPKLDPSRRRDAARINLRLNREERRIVDEKAARAGVTPHEWVRLAALERDPPARATIPELNSEAWHRMAPLVEALERASRRLQPGALHATVEDVRGELVAMRNLLLGGQS
jgi:uncharacterized protein (DUF1778 family)